MSGKHSRPGPGQGSFGQFQLEVARPPKKDYNEKRQWALGELDKSIPKNEDQWREVRQQHDFRTPGDIHSKVSTLVHDALLPQHLQDLRRFIYVAVCCVDRHCGDTEAYDNYRTCVGNQNLSERTINNYISSVLGVISLMDKLYSENGLRHRAFEAILLFAPLGISFLSHYKQAPDNFKSCFPKCKIVPEEQASLALYLPFIIKYRRPRYRYGEICKALNTRVLSEDEYLNFVSILEGGKPIPYMLPAHDRSQTQASTSASSSVKGHYDPVRDDWHSADLTGNQQDDWLTMLNPQHFPTLLPFQSTTPYCVFNTSEELQQMAKEAGGNQVRRHEAPCDNTVKLFAYDYTPKHDSVADRTITDLVILGLLTKGDLGATYRRAICLERGCYKVPHGKFDIIIPTANKRCKLSLADNDLYTWGVQSGFVLNEHTRLQTEVPLQFVSIRFLIDRADKG